MNTEKSRMVHFGNRASRDIVAKTMILNHEYLDEIGRLVRLKDEAIENAEYVEATEIGDRLEMTRQKNRQLFSEPEFLNAQLECVSQKMNNMAKKMNNMAKKMPFVAQALEKLSGDLSHDNVAAAKQILKKILKGG